MNSFSSLLQPSSNRSRVAASTASIAFSGASRPGARRSASSCAAANSGPLTVLSPRLELSSRVFRGPRPFASRSRVQARAPCSRSPGTRWSMIPLCRASGAPIGSPWTIISSALATPASRGNRCVPPAPGIRPESYFRLAKLSRSHSHPIMAGKGDFKPSAQRVPVDGADHRLRAILKSQHERIEPDLRLFPSRGHLLELPDIGACDESSSGSDQDDRISGRIGSCFADRRNDAVRHTGAQRIDRRIVDADECEVPFFAERNQFGHTGAAGRYRTCHPGVPIRVLRAAPRLTHNQAWMKRPISGRAPLRSPADSWRDLRESCCHPPDWLRPGPDGLSGEGRP